jgi:ubiquinone/menaquinone biosynthesis C-methylase UbiE
MTTAVKRRHDLYEVSEAIAPTWARRRAFVEEVSAPVREWMIRALDPRPGQTILELAAGVGDTGFEVASVLGDRGLLISSDWIPAMIDAARRRGAELGLENVDYRVIDAERTGLDADSVDGVLCRFGYMLMADPATAFAETRRVLRPDGTLALAVWGSPDRNPFFAIIGMSLVERGHMPPPDPEGPGIFSLGAEERLRTLLEGAGFSKVRTEEIPVRFRFADIDEYLSIARDAAGPIAFVLRELAEAEWQAIEAKLEEAFVPFAGDEGYEVPGVALCAVAG